MQILSNTHQGPPCPFRACGKTGDAGNYPYNSQALLIVAEHNGIPVDKLTKGMRYASNPYMQKWMALLGGLKLEGLPYRNDNGALLGYNQALKIWLADYAERRNRTLATLGDD